MELAELSQVYLESARLLDGRIAELNAQAAQTSDPSLLLQLNTRLCKLREMRQDTRATGIMLQNYYRKGGSLSHEQKNGPLS